MTTISGFSGDALQAYSLLGVSSIFAKVQDLVGYYGTTLTGVIVLFNNATYTISVLCCNGVVR